MKTAQVIHFITSHGEYEEIVINNGKSCLPMGAIAALSSELLGDEWKIRDNAGTQTLYIDGNSMQTGSQVVYIEPMADEAGLTFTITEINEGEDWAIIRANVDMNIKPTYSVYLSKLREITLPESLAITFARVLRMALSNDQLQTIIDRNLAPEYADLCASHDFCDSNMAMELAFQMVTGYASEPIFYAIGKPEAIPQGERDVDLINAAWTIAKANNFAI